MPSGQSLHDVGQPLVLTERIGRARVSGTGRRSDQEPKADMTGQQADRTFSAALENFVEGRAELAPELWSFIHWLEDRGQTFHFRNSDRMFLPTVPIASVDRMWSNLYFSIDSGLVAAWFGQDCHDDGSLIPLVRCGGDGSYLALWRDSGAADRYCLSGLGR